MASEEKLLKAAADKDAKLDYTMAKVAPEFAKGEVLKSIFIFFTTFHSKKYLNYDLTFILNYGNILRRIQKYIQMR